MSTLLPPVTLHFGGEAATRLAGEKLLTPRQLQKALDRDDTPYLGKLPKAFRSFGVPEAQVLKALDMLATDLVADNAPQRFDSERIPGLSGELLGRGLFGAVYRLSIGDEAFAFKIFLPASLNKTPGWLMDRVNRMLRQGAYAEPALGRYATEQGTRDVAVFHVANPSARWQMVEYVDPDGEPPTNRAGKSLTEQGYMFQDSNRGENSIHGIRIDYGGWLKKNLSGRAVQRLMTGINNIAGR